MAILTFPEQASATPFKWLMLNWNPQGHIPPGVYDVPHHDFHFYIMEQSKLDEIKAGTCEAGGEGVDCETFERGMAPVPAEYVAPDYITVGAVVPAMGNHPGQSRLNRPQVWDSGSLGSDESRKSFDLYVL